MKRSDIYTVSDVKIGNTIYKERDLLRTAFSEFQMKRSPVYHTVTSVDLKRPYLISYQYYTTVSFWWIICQVNGINNIFEDLYVGQILVIPSILDIHDFQRKLRMRRA